MHGDYSQDDILEEMLLKAEDEYWRLKGPHATRTDFPTEFNGWKLDVAEIYYNRLGSEGETAHNENGTNRGYDSPTIPNTLARQIVPTAAVNK